MKKSKKMRIAYIKESSLCPFNKSEIPPTPFRKKIGNKMNAKDSATKKFTKFSFRATFSGQ